MCHDLGTWTIFETFDDRATGHRPKVDHELPLGRQINHKDCHEVPTLSTLPSVAKPRLLACCCGGHMCVGRHRTRQRTRTYEPLKAHEDDAMMQRWLDKEVIQSRRLDDMEATR